MPGGTIRVNEPGTKDASRRETKSVRLNLRATSTQVSVIRQAARLDGVSLSVFMLTSSVDRAEQILKPAQDRTQEAHHS